MWFSFPDGTESITVQHQAFTAEVTDAKGKMFFRAPDHFSPLILSIKGFNMEHPPETSLEDLPKDDPLRDSAIAQLATTNEALKVEIQGLRTDVNQLRAENTALKNDNGNYNRLVQQAAARIQELEEAFDNKAEEQPQEEATDEEEEGEEAEGKGLEGIEGEAEVDPNAPPATTSSRKRK
jgi:hypothetical protein